MTTTLSRCIQLPGATPTCVAAVAGRHSGAQIRLGCSWPTPSVAVVGAVGEIDASNVDDLTGYAIAHLMRCRVLVLDLTGLKFFGTEGFLALQRISACCAWVGAGWAVVPGAAVTRVLRLCDPHGMLPAACTLDAAIATASRRLDRLRLDYGPMGDRTAR